MATNNLKFWQEAVQSWIDLEKRNQQIAETIFKSWKWFTKDSVLAATWLSWKKSSDFGATDKDFQSTFEDIKSRYDKLGSSSQNQQIVEPKFKITKESLTTWPKVGATAKTEFKTADKGQIDPALAKKTTTWIEWLWEAEMQVYDMLTDTEKRQFEAIWENAAKEWRDFAKEQAQYLADIKRAKEQLQSQRERQTQVDELSWEITDIKDSETILSARESLENLQQNIWMLWTMGRL